MIHIKDSFYMKRKELNLAQRRFEKSISESYFGRFMYYLCDKLNNLLLKW